MDDITNLKIEMQFINDRLCLIEQRIEEIDVNNWELLTKLEEKING